MGRAYYEMVEYPKALQVFAQLQAVEPHRLEGAEIHSTILWHLKREVGRRRGVKGEGRGVTA
jgi:anaphase-promoting complex subunit 3